MKYMLKIRREAWFLLGLLSVFLLFPFTVKSQQKIQIVNDNTASLTDANIWVLVTGNPAQVTDMNGGVRDLSQVLPTGTVTADSTSFTSFTTSYKSASQIVPFPILFTSGNNNDGKVYKVKSFNPSTGQFTLDSALPNLPKNSDMFEIGVYSQKLSTMKRAGTFSFTSTLSGDAAHVYEFTANNIASGVIFISQDSTDAKGNSVPGALAYFNASPTFQSADKIPFQTVELSTGSQTSVDTTVIDYFSIPLQIEALDSSGNSIPDTVRTFYVGKDTIISKIESFGGVPINTNQDKDFVRFLGPGQVIDANQGNPAPYASFAHYLENLADNGTTFKISKTKQGFLNPNPAIVYGLDVSQYMADYNYSGVVQKTADGYKVVLTPEATGNSITPQAPTTTVTTVESDIANITVTVNLPIDSLNETIYGATLTIGAQGSFSLDPAPSLADYPGIVTTGKVTAGINTSSFISSTFGGNKSYIPPFTIKYQDLDYNVSSCDSSGTFTVSEPFPQTPTSGEDFTISLDQERIDGTVTTGISTTSFTSDSFKNKDYAVPFDIRFTSGTNVGNYYTVNTLAADGTFTLAAPLVAVSAVNDDFYVLQPTDTVLTQFYTNSVYSYAVADVLAALNFGFLGSQNAGDTGAEWYATFPQRYPFVQARAWTGHPDDHFYNEWASIFYNCSDAYSFAFSDRVSPSPLIGVKTNSQQILRITYLPENQLDAPVVSMASQTDTGIDITWTASELDTDVTYDVAIEPNDAQTVITKDSLTASITGLTKATPYTIKVKAVKGNQQSLVLPLYTSTTGTYDPLTYTAGAGIVPFQIAFTWSLGSDPSAGLKCYYGATEIDLTKVETFNAYGKNGTNQYVFDFQQDGASVFKTALTLDLKADGADPAKFTVTGTPELLYNDNTANPVILAPIVTGNSYDVNLVPNPPTSPLVVSLNFDPVARKMVAASTGEQAKLTVAVSPSAGGTTNHSLGVHSEPQDVPIAIEATPNADYVFKEWTVEKSGIIEDPKSPSTTVTLYGDATITANFVQKSGTPTKTLTMAVSPGASGTTTPAVGGNTETVNVPIPIEATPAGGFVFSKWTATGPATIEDPQNASTKVTISDDATVTAVFVATPADVTLTMAASPADGGTTTPAVGDSAVSEGVSHDITASPGAGYNFSHWTVTGTAKISDASQKNTSVTLTDDATVTAVFVAQETPATLSVSVTPDSSGTTNPGAGGDISCHIGKVFSISAQPAAGYHFTKWTGTGVIFNLDTNQNSNSIKITSATATLTANFAADTVPTTLTVAVVGSGTTNPGAGSHTGYQIGELVTIQATADSGNHFTGWTGSDVTITDANNPTTSFKIDSATPTITANFAADVTATTLTVSVNPGAGGTTNPGVGVHTNYQVGQVIPIVAIPAAAYHFTGWSGTGLTIVDDTKKSTTVTINNAVSTLTADFAANQLTVAIAHASISEKGGSSPATVTRNSGISGDLVVNLASSDTNEATVPATVTIKDGSDSASFTVTAVDDGVPDGTKTVTITATATNYIQGTDTVDIKGDTPYQLMVNQGTGSGLHIPGVVIPISADAPQTGQAFDKWTGDVANVANVNDADTTITMPAAAATITATYVVDPGTAEKITNGSEIKVTTSEISGMDAEFMRPPTVYGKYTDPVSLVAKSATTMGVTRISSATPNSEYVSQWSRIVGLFNKTDWVNANKTGTSTAVFIANLPGGKINDVDCHLWVKAVTADRKTLNVHFRGALLTPPVITGAVNWGGSALTKVHPGSKIIIQGNYFGDNPPIVSLEYLSGGSYKQQRLKVLTPYPYPNAKGSAGKSCMDLSSDTGYSEITVQMPKAWWTGWASGNYDLVLNNNLGLSIISIPTTDSGTDPNNPPVATNYTDTLQTGTSAYYIDVTSNDDEPEGDPVTINLPNNLSTLNGRISVAQGKVKYIPPQGVLPAAFPDTFTYSLSDGQGGTSGIATVTINMNAITLDPIKHWDGDALGTRTVQPGSKIILSGQNFGIQAPKVTIAVENGKILKLKVVSKAQYENYKGRANTSYTDLTTGDSSVTVQLPKRAWPGYTDGKTYTINISNSFDTAGANGNVTTSSGNTAPVANDDSVNIQSGEKVYYIDVLANQSDTNAVSFNTDGKDADAESDGVKIILPSRTSTLGARLQVDSKTNTIKYIRAKDSESGFTDTFTYSLQDPSGAVSGTATVTVYGQ